MSIPLSKPAPKKGEKDIDIHIGKKLHLRRNIMGLSQEKLGESINVSFQQVQKYEKGKNRVSASKLHEISHILNVPVHYFFEGLSAEKSVEAFEDSPGFQNDVLNKKETLELLRNYYRITNPDLRKKVIDIVKTIGLSEGN